MLYHSGSQRQGCTTHKCRLKSSQYNHPSQGTLTKCYIILGPRDKAAPPTRQEIGQFLPKQVKYQPCHPFLFLFLPHPQESSLRSRPIRGKVCWTGQIFPEHAEWSFLDPEHSFIVVWQMPPKVRPIKTQLCSPKEIKWNPLWAGPFDPSWHYFQTGPG